MAGMAALCRGAVVLGSTWHPCSAALMASAVAAERRERVLHFDRDSLKPVSPTN